MALAVAAATVTYLTVPLTVDVICTEADLVEDEVCLQTVLEEWKGENVVWVDARGREQFTKQAVPGAVLINMDPQENFDELVAEAVEQLAMADRVVVYCGASSCKASKQIVASLKETGLVAEAFALYGGVKALKRAELF